jgi:prolyl-tRNA editing enzyme YbaK/EbsC (Cys-tRNA(Pro) deacylase)
LQIPAYDLLILRLSTGLEVGDLVVAETLPEIKAFLEQAGYPFEVWECAPELADTAIFCEHYGVSLENSANAILVTSKTGEKKYVLCVLLATHRLDTNHTVRKKIGARKVSFASADETRELTGMEIGGVTPLVLPNGLPVWIDEAVMQTEYIILGGGNRSSKLKVIPTVLTMQPEAEVVVGLANRI